jgi:hypothetical protein
MSIYTYVGCELVVRCAEIEYDKAKAASIAHTAQVDHSSLREAALKQGHLTAKNSIS